MYLILYTVCLEFNVIDCPPPFCRLFAALVILISPSGFSKLWRHWLLGLSGYAAFSVSGTSAVNGFTRLWSYRGRRQIVSMERTELMYYPLVKPIFTYITIILDRIITYSNSKDIPKQYIEHLYIKVFIFGIR